MNKRRLFNIGIFRKVIFIFSIIVISEFFISKPVKAATFYLSPATKKVSVGDIVTVSLYINTQEKTINNAEANIQFPPDLIEVISINSKSSIFSLWVEQPSFSNTNGSISFNGGVPNPGYVGKSGQVLNINFRTKKTGEATLLYNGAAIRENDGLGTDILSGQASATISITSVVAEPEKPKTEEKPITAEPVKPITKPSETTPVIYSDTYPNQNSWYSQKDGIVFWKVPTKAKTVQTFLDFSSDTTPTVTYTPPISQKSINLSEGIWYFHLRYFIDSKWTPTAHYKIRIDSTPPEDLNIIVDKSNNCLPVLSLKAGDALSGIDYFDVFVDDLPVIKILGKEAELPISLPQLTPGQHQVMVSVFDRAGNKKEASTDFDIEKTLAPVIFSRDTNIKAGERAKITGKTTQPQAIVKIIVQSSSGNEVAHDIVTDENGNFSFISEPINQPGNYLVWVYQVACDGQIGEMTEKYSLSVELPVIISACHCPIGASCLKYQILSLVLGIILLVFIIFGTYKYLSLRKRFNTLAKNSNLVFDLLVEKANKEISVLEKSQKKKSAKSKENKAISNLKDIVEKIESIKK
ncbi:MAG: cohesin domain-containing protein [Candidatus Magasanikbacteria bacterium]|nr:cohesin domain-containing protein [Candidatus Magasanikbacteria bacterium]